MSAKKDPLASYDDNVIADLPNFLEMATYEDPFDDLALFFAKADRWACSKGPDGTFWLFPELPCEIRLMIWEQCIPSQVHLVAENVYEGLVDDRLDILENAIDDNGWNPRPTFEASEEIDKLHESLFGCPAPYTVFDEISNLDRAMPYHNRNCKPAYPTAFRQKLPFIAQVNHEARSHAPKHQTRYRNLAFVHKDMLAEIDRVEGSPVWLNCNKDTVLVNTQYQYPPADAHSADTVSGDGDGRVDVRKDDLLDMVTGNKIQTAIYSDVLESAPPSFYRSLTKTTKAVDIVVGVFQFRDILNSTAAITDLFGLFGEESMALIPAKNSLLLRKLFNAHAAFGPDYYEETLHAYHAFQRVFEVPRRPSDFDEYCELMRGLARGCMTSCEHNLLRRGFGGPDGEALRRQWKADVSATFWAHFNPVFIVHRCRSSVLTDARYLDEP